MHDSKVLSPPPPGMRRITVWAGTDWFQVDCGATGLNESADILANALVRVLTQSGHDVGMTGKSIVWS